MTGRFVAVGTGHYQDPAWTELPAALTDVDVLTGLFADGGLDASCLRDLTEAQIKTELRRLLPPKQGAQAGTLVVFWSGHGQLPREHDLRLIVADSEKEDTPWLTASYITSAAIRSGAAQILLFFDTCYSGVATAKAIGRAAELLAQQEGTDLWVGVVASALDWQKASDGRFGAQLVRLLQHGPADSKMQVRWSPHNEQITTDDLMDALLADWDHRAGQHPEQAQWSRAAPGVLMRNPRFSPTAPPRVVEQLVDAARGGDPDEEWYFTGRQFILATLTGWIADDQPGVKVLTGPPGSGKSAVLGQLLCLSDPERRAELLRYGSIESADPGAGAIHAHLAARGLTVKQAVRALDEQLSDRGLIGRERRGLRGRGELLDAVEESAVRPVIVIDGLDEAGEPWLIADQLIRSLSGRCLILVGTRELTDAAGGARELGDKQGGAPLIARLQADPGQVISLLDAPSDDADVRAYVTRRLRERDPRMDPELVATAVLAQRARPDEGLFLLARVLTAQLRAEPVDTSSPDWGHRLARSVEDAFDRDLETSPPLTTDNGELVARAARDLLTALAWGFGAGLPDDLWADVAGAISGRAYTTDEVYFALQTAGRYVVEDGDGQRAVFRLAHQRLVSHLRGATPEHAPQAIAAAVTGRYAQALDAGPDLSRARYLVRYTWRHCVEADLPGLELLRELGRRHPDRVTADVGVAFRWFGEHRTPADDTAVTIAALEEARVAYATLTERDAGYRAELARTLNGLGLAYSWARRPEAVETTSAARDLFRALAEENPAYLPDYGWALLLLGTRYQEAARFQESLDATETAASIFADLVRENTAYRPRLAAATLNLSFAHATLHQDREAAAAALNAFTVFTELWRENPGYRSEQARAESNVAARLAAIGEMTVAVAAADSSVEVLTRLSEQDPAQRLHLAAALNTAANVYSVAGDAEAGLRAARRAAELFRGLAAEDPTERPRLAQALSNLSNREAEAGNTREAVGPALEAARLLREDVADHPSRALDLAGSLVNLSIRLEESDPQAAGRAANEAVQLCLGLPADASTDRTLASAFNSASRALRRMGRATEAAGVAAQAVEIYQSLVAGGRAQLGYLLGALTTQTRAHLDADDQAGAEAAWRRARDAFDDPDTKVQFLVAESKVAAAGRGRFALIEAVGLVRSPSQLALQVRQLARLRYRAEPDAMRYAWLEETGTPIPAGLTLDPDLCLELVEWFAAGDVAHTRAYHEAHLSQFAGEAALAAFDEVAPTALDDGDIEQYRWALLTARDHGLDEVYPR
jgi:caspase domain-containing protein/AAA domain-containing protein